MSRRKIEIRDDEIYELREKGMSYGEIAKYFTKKGVKIGLYTIRLRCKKIYEGKGEEEPKEKEIKKRNSVTNEEIYKLRNQGMTYKEIMEYFEKKGVKISIDTLSVRCKKIYKEKGQEEPKIKNRINEATDEEIYELREQGESYEEIARYYNGKGIEISKATIAYRCKKIYNEKGKEAPKIKKGKNKREDVTDEEIYELREQGKSYEEIARYYNGKGIEISKATIAYRCKKIYKEKGQEEPKIKRKNMVKEATDEEIYELRNQGMTYKEIMEYFEKKGVKISIDTLSVRCKKIYKEKGQEEPKIKNRINEATDEEIYELREQGMTYERIAEYYSIKGIKITYSAIGYRCKKIYKEKGQEEPKIKNRINEATDEEIYKLREQKMTYKEMMEYFEKKGVKISINTLWVRCKKIYKEKGQEEPKIKRKNMVKEATDEEIYELREQGMTHKEIVKYFKDKGIPITRVTIAKRCKTIYIEKRKEEPKAKKGKKERDDVTNEELYELREKGMKYEEIVKYFEEKGIKISQSQVCKRCKKIYEEKGEEEPKAKRGRKAISGVTDEEIYELSEQGLLHEEIAQYFNDKGIHITGATIGKRCKEIYKEKGKEEPKAKKGKKERKDVTNEEIYELRKQGMTYGDITKYYNEKGIKINPSTIGLRCKKIYEEKGEEEPKAKRGRKAISGVTDEEIYELSEQGLLHEEIAQYFNDKGIHITGATIGKRCKEIYKEKGKKEPKTKRGRKERKDVTNEEIYKLREKGMSYGEIVKYFNDKGIQISLTTIWIRCKKIYEEKGQEVPKETRKNEKTEECLLGRLDDTLNGKIKEKIGTEQALAELKYKEKNTEGAEK